ncbi:MAG: hypothetical protein ABEH47_05430 [Haloferacaceae archaeon]
MRRRYLLSLVAGLAGCGARPAADGPAATGTSEDTFGVPLSADATYGYTYLRPDGNRFAAGRGRVPDASPVDVSLSAPVEWVVAAPEDAGPATVWGVLMADSGVRALRVDGCSVTDITPVTANGEGPPLLVSNDGRVRLLNAGSAFSHPTPIPNGAATVDRYDTTLSVPGGPLEVEAIPDARVVVADGLVYVLGKATDRYAHGVLGDEIEGGAVAVVDPRTRDVRYLRPESGVIEDTKPIVTDVDGDGDLEVLVPVSDADRGTRLVTFRPGGGVEATGPPVGTGYRWRHQIAVGPFGPGGEREIAAVRTPHLGGVAEFYRADGDEIRLVATRDGGYASHRSGSRNLDMAAAGDFDGDGRPELLVPGGDGRRLVALRRTDGGVAEAWTVPVGGRLRTNVAAAAGERGLTLGVGRGETLRLWPAGDAGC